MEAGMMTIEIESFNDDYTDIQEHIMDTLAEGLSATGLVFSARLLDSNGEMILEFGSRSS